MIGKRVKQLRTERGLSLTELAEKAGVAKSYLSTIERDIQSNPSIHFSRKYPKFCMCQSRRSYIPLK